MFINKHKKVSRVTWFDGVTATFLYKTVPKSNTKRQKLFIQCQHFKDGRWHLMKMRKKKKKKDGIVLFFCFRTWWTGHCVCKSIRVHAHTQAYTHYPQTGSSVCSVRSGEMKWKSAEFDLFCLSATPQPAYFYSVISYVSQNDLTTPWELAWTCILLL